MYDGVDKVDLFLLFFDKVDIFLLLRNDNERILVEMLQECFNNVVGLAEPSDVDRQHLVPAETVRVTFCFQKFLHCSEVGVESSPMEWRHKSLGMKHIWIRFQAQQGGHDSQSVLLNVLSALRPLNLVAFVAGNHQGSTALAVSGVD